MKKKKKTNKNKTKQNKIKTNKTIKGEKEKKREGEITLKKKE